MLHWRSSRISARFGRPCRCWSAGWRAKRKVSNALQSAVGPADRFFFTKRMQLYFCMAVPKMSISRCHTIGFSNHMSASTYQRWTTTTATMTTSFRMFFAYFHFCGNPCLRNGYLGKGSQVVALWFWRPRPKPYEMDTPSSMSGPTCSPRLDTCFFICFLNYAL